MIDLAHVVGRYGVYIWPAYGVSFAGLIAMLIDTAARARRWRREVDRRLGEVSENEPDDP